MRHSKIEIFIISLGYLLGGLVLAFSIGIILLGFYTVALFLEGIRFIKKLIIDVLHKRTS